MAQNNGLIIGIIALLIIVGGVYLLFFSPANPSTPPGAPNPPISVTPGSFIQEYGLSADFEVSRTALAQKSITELEQLLKAPAVPYVGETKLFVEIYSILIDALISEKEIAARAEKISQDGIENICTNLSTIQERISFEEKKTETITLLNGKINAYNTNYPTNNYQFNPIEIDVGQDADRIARARENLAALTIDCEGNNA